MSTEEKFKEKQKKLLAKLKGTDQNKTKM